jgi:hypothetical protein
MVTPTVTILNTDKNISIPGLRRCKLQRLKVYYNTTNRLVKLPRKYPFPQPEYTYRIITGRL